MDRLCLLYFYTALDVVLFKRFQIKNYQVSERDAVEMEGKIRNENTMRTVIKDKVS